MKYFIGLPQWHHPNWHVQNQPASTTLQTYSQHFSSVVSSRIGIIWLQMNRYFSPEQLPLLERFLHQLPKEFSYGIEIRHPKIESHNTVLSKNRNKSLCERCAIHPPSEEGGLPRNFVKAITLWQKPPQQHNLF